ncbi:MAG: aldose 1-epimerase family protein [Clostridia bacterium]|nr:aldose 1-epimerase family protein [Clostridia bacterium]
MAEQIIIKNNDISAVISTMGAELCSIKNTKGTEFIWQGDENFWMGHSPVLFPICGGLKDDKYILEGKEYTLDKHGYARFTEFECILKEESKAVFSLKSNAESLKSYPYEYDFRITYEVVSNTLKVIYEIENKTDKIMYTSFGAHEGYACPEGIEDYEIVFDKEETLDTCTLAGSILDGNTKRILDCGKVLKLNYDYFATDALVFKNLNSKGATLRKCDGTKECHVDFEGFNYFLLWTKPGAKYICLEPWCGIHDDVNSDYDITKKEGIEKIAPKDTISRTHIVTVKD